jgi:hypothetical protein
MKHVGFFDQTPESGLFRLPDIVAVPSLPLRCPLSGNRQRRVHDRHWGAKLTREFAARMSAIPFALLEGDAPDRPHELTFEGSEGADSFTNACQFDRLAPRTPVLSASGGGRLSRPSTSHPAKQIGRTARVRIKIL